MGLNLVTEHLRLVKGTMADAREPKTVDFCLCQSILDYLKIKQGQI